MKEYQVRKIRYPGLGMAFLLVALIAGCGQQAASPPPTFTSIAANNGVQGQAVAVTLTGTNFATGATIGISGTGITQSGATLVSSTQITATFAIAANATPGAQNITVTSGGNTTLPRVFTVGLLTT